VALIACGLANMDVTETHTRVRTIKLPTPPPRVITKTKTVRVSNPIPEGFMTKAECNRLVIDADLHTIIARYGWPHGSSGDDSDSTNMYYPVDDPRSDDRCEITFYQGKLERVDFDTGLS